MLYNESMTTPTQTWHGPGCCPRHALRPDLYAAPCDFGTPAPFVHPALAEAVRLLDKAIDECRPTCAARRSPNHECVCAELDALGR